MLEEELGTETSQEEAAPEDVPEIETEIVLDEGETFGGL